MACPDLFKGAMADEILDRLPPRQFAGQDIEPLACFT